MCGEVIEKDLETPHQYLDRVPNRTTVAGADRLIEAGHPIEAV